MLSARLHYFISLFLVAAFFIGPVSQAQSKTTVSHSPQQAQKLVGIRSQTVMRALSKLDMAMVARYTHPQKGVAFYPYLAGDKPQKRTRRQLRGFLWDPGIYLWGSYDGTGDPIKLSNKDYFRKFIYDDNFSQPKEINYNTFKPRGNTLNLLPRKYPHAVLVEFYRPAKSSHGYDWKGLWLVWQKADGQWYLVAIAHDEWTI
jgi:hypothetical protein